MQIAFIEDAAGIDRSFELMSRLRPRLSREDYLAAVPRLMATSGYRLVGLEDGGLRALAGIRIGEWLHGGRYLEIEELVTAEADRSRGYGHALLAWIAAYARTQECRQLRLVSGVQRSDAHRFYAREGMAWEAKYFSMDLA
ncbi:GNAT family N-acetyltransferase [Pseudoxanthomonas daejeonensis]|uniref:GNAT family N-acetyltransferase n=1 Tax=Pseudoxanthomonas daejeonensis TaxID=266062 RepID=A0ABQ6Z3Z3_9GAMM|nr:GNAT family N-acetyltransferase [Pseudoxanthomonas daejeonensis]KAF1692226.1 GNAT family N-acetyltransferase [Pseudoxanthomonas daejeonensis]UNK56291.1 GNAT family N-acetyltransferase [Pseudoxanthomonas daejeonensis]